MQAYDIKIKLVTDYLQARFTEDAKKELQNYISKGIIKSKEDSWKVLIYEDEKGIYIPNIQVRNCLVKSGQEFKVKKKRSSMKQWCQSSLMIKPDRIHIGKKDPDDILVSYPKRKDGSTVTMKHPLFKAGLNINFILNVLDDEMEAEAVKNLIVMGGKMYGIGARRADMYGRFDLVSMS